MKNIDFVVRRNEDDFVVYSEDFEHGYNVVPKEVDPCNAFDIEEVRTWCSNHLSKVVDAGDAVEVPADVDRYLSLKAGIEADIRYLDDTDDVAFQLARHERGTEILSDGKLEDCLAKDRKRGEISAGLKRRRAEAEEMLGKLKAKYGMSLGAVFGIRG